MGKFGQSILFFKERVNSTQTIVFCPKRRSRIELRQIFNINRKAFAGIGGSGEKKLKEKSPNPLIPAQ
jgi:hypothetical protein